MKKTIWVPITAILVVGTLIIYALRSSDPTPEQQADAPASGVPDRAAEVPSTSGPSWKEIDDPTQDGWDTEVFASKAKKQLKILGKLLAHPGDIDAADMAKLVTDDFACSSLLPDNQVTVLDDQHLEISRPSSVLAGGSPSEGPAGRADLPLRGGGGLAETLRAAGELFSTATNVRYEVKVFRVADGPDEVSTRQYFSISGQAKSGTIEQHATWDIGWTRESGGTPPRMRWLRVVDFEQTRSRQSTGTLFADCTQSALGGNRSYGEQFLHGMNHWFQRIQDRSPWQVLGNPGLAVGDVNGDGLDDLYVCQEAGLPNRLFIQNSDGTAREESAAWGVDWLQSSRSALLVDLDNDADQDLVVAIIGGVVVAENDGKGRFRLRDVLATADDTMSLSAVDYDLDGRLDIYVCAYFQNRKPGQGETAGLAGATAEFVVHDANTGGSNAMFHNEISEAGVWQFSDVTRATGLDQNNHRYSLAASWDDFDNDGDQDLYVANDYGRDHFYLNDFAAKQRSTRPFVDVSESVGAEDSATGMSVTWSDYDRDGWMDVFVSNMWSSAGHRIAFQDKFRAGGPDEIKRRIQRLARGNTLLQNQGDVSFGDRSAPAGIEMGRWAWGGHFADLNNDGWEDLIIPNGFITTEDTGDL
ncbi:MAG: VCBS repeat-containing protein [Akkermansiaceae bacterium]|nr:VCBS repeat-containing protein [Akkermansiaceae bacterium]